LVGGLLGFIFGIPRSLTGDQPATGPGPGNATDAAAHSRPNTNLEQISDWLTKILVGAGLTTLTFLPDFISRTIAGLDHGPYRTMPGGGTLAVFIILAFLALGFFWSYIETRTLFTVLFDTYGQQVPPDVLLNVRSAPADPGSPPIPQDKIVLSLNERVLQTPALLEARAAAEVRKGDLDAARDHYMKALQLDPGNPRLEMRLSSVLARTGEPEKAQAIVQRVETASATNAAQQSQVQALKVGNALYKPSPEGFTEALQIGEPLLSGDQANNGQLHLWLACAYGQRAASRYPNGQVPPDDSDRQKALARLEDMKRLRPDLLPLARQLWRPEQYNGDPKENDLSVFRDDPDFNALLTSS
jgi:tetratricopeptide (TPR) repeat protein